MVKAKPIPKQYDSPPGVRAPSGERDALPEQHLKTVYHPSNPNSTGFYPVKVIEQIPPSLVDCLTTLQSTNEKELTSCLCQNTYKVLKLAGNFLPEITSRERSFWLLVKRSLPYNLNTDDAIRFILELIRKNGYQQDYFEWERLYFENFLIKLCNSEERTRQLLIEITACHKARTSLEIVYQSHRFQEMGGYYE